jgi:hypothetical protein
MKDKDLDKIEKAIERLDGALENLKKDNAQGRVYVVGTLVSYDGKLGVVQALNTTAKDPAGSTVDIRLDSGKVIEKVSVTSSVLQLLRS